MTDKAIVIVVDDDSAVRDSMRSLLESAGYTVRDYPSAAAFLKDPVPPGSCLVTDIRMPEMDGLELQEEIKKRGLDIPVVIMTGHGDVPLAVRAMKAGALDFVEKPFDDQAMLASVERALLIGHQERARLAEAKAAQELIARLTPRERNVLEKLVAGRSNKVAAYELGISPRTIEIHRANIMDKMRARSLSDVVRIALAADHSRAGHA
ncbi:MAG TPA: response regulator FixJ [Rhizomicrobium sp.]|nr:response regulator FixJ [Rhizomicrobium sp.]